MKLNRPWRMALRRLAAAVLRLSRRPPRLRFDREALAACIGRRRELFSLTRRRVFFANILSGLLIAFSVYFLDQTALPDRISDAGIRAFLYLKLLLFERRTVQAPLLPTIASLLLAVSLAASLCTFVRSLRLAVLLNLGLAAGIVVINLNGPLLFPVPLSAAPVIVLITLGAILDHYLHVRFLRRRSRLAAERQETGFAIIRHLTHSLNPTIRTALSPILAVQGHLGKRGTAAEVIGRRRDGSDERVGDALDAAVVSLGQMRDILDTTEDLFAGRIEEKDFVEVELAALFEREILPLFSGARFTIETDFAGAGKVWLHRPSFVQAIKNLLRNAEVHGFPDGFVREEGLRVRFSARRTGKEIVIDYVNNGMPFPRGLRTADFLAFGRKGRNSPGKGLGGAWVARFIELHHGAFRKIGNDPVHFRITLPRRRLT
ncbi:MAG: sensor histidine kinase [Geobacteraceae bacterium]|nr:sensor histidine kinase [Geobacteraceae bacterium]